MSLWIVDSGSGFALSFIARVEDWKEGEHIDVTGADDNGKGLPVPVRYVSLSSVTDGQRKMSDRITSLEAENAKLRKLVRKAHACKTHGGCCEDCYEDKGRCPIERKMRKLGIEVQR